MYIVDVIPLAFIPRNQTQILSYFFNEPLKSGALVQIPYNHREIQGVVIGSEPIKSMKLNFKKGVDFELKKITKVISNEPQVSGVQFKIAKYVSDYYYAPLGVCLKTVLPPFFGKKGYQFKEIGSSAGESGSKTVKTNLKNHSLDYEKEVKKKIKNGQQVFLMVAENTAGKYFLEKFKELNPAYISSATKTKEYKKIWKESAEGKVKLIIGTRIGLFLPFDNLGLIIIDDESNEFYKSDMMPRYNAAGLAKFASKLYGAEIISGSEAPRVETYFENPNIDLGQAGRQTKTVNMIDEIKAGNFSIFSRKLKDEIFNLKDNIILYIPRRGCANFVSCQKCGRAITCPNCSASLVVHKSVASPNPLVVNPLNHVLICHHCAFKQTSPKNCPACGSYKLKAVGIGAEKVVDELEKLKKYNNLNFKIFKLDSDESNNIDEKEVKIIEEFKKTKPSILVTTQIIFSHRYLIKTEFTGIINADSLVNIPDFRTEESTFRQIATLRELSRYLLIQTHNPENQSIKLAAEGNFDDFYKNELKNRKVFSYPPFSQLIKLTLKYGNPAKARTEARILYEKLLRVGAPVNKQITAEQKIEILEPNPAFIAKEKGLYIWNIIIKFKLSAGEQKPQKGELKIRNELLRIVPSGWTIDVDPTRVI